MTSKINILIVDDEKDICDQISGLLSDNGYLTISVNSSEEAIKTVKKQEITLVILDIWLNNSKLDGFKTLEEIKRLYDFIPIIMISGHGNIETAVNSIKRGAFDFIEKPFDSDLLIFKVKKALENINLKKKIEKLTKERLDFKFVHESSSTKNLYNLIKKISKTESTILLTGPSGSGKEVIAKTIHNFSNRSNKSFEILSCANLDPVDLEKKLYDVRVNNNFTEDGILQKVNGGTILLDQVEDLPIESQGKIIRFLEDQKYSTVGSTTYKNLNLRIISSSKVNLVRHIKEKKFREDLYFKLNVLPIEIPSLKDRKEDIKELCDIFLKEYVHNNNLKYKTFSEDCINFFKTVSFPGNVRQLKNLVEWIMIILSDDKSEEISYKKLPDEIKLYLNNNIENNLLSNEFSSCTLKEAKDIFEKKYLEYQLFKFNYNINKTSNFVGMERTALYRKIKILNINLQK